MTARTHHVNLPVPPGASASVAEFYVEVLGFSVAPRPETGRAGVWLDVGDGTQVHLSERDSTADPDQHVAFVVDDFADVERRARATTTGWRTVEDGRAVLRDPAGNLVELFAAGTEPR